MPPFCKIGYSPLLTFSVSLSEISVLTSSLICLKIDSVSATGLHVNFFNYFIFFNMEE